MVNLAQAWAEVYHAVAPQVEVEVSARSAWGRGPACTVDITTPAATSPEE
jgi:hypothetical protein